MTIDESNVVPFVRPSPRPEDPPAPEPISHRPQLEFSFPNLETLGSVEMRVSDERGSIVTLTFYLCDVVPEDYDIRRVARAIGHWGGASIKNTQPAPAS